MENMSPIHAKEIRPREKEYEEEREAKYLRMLTSALLGVKRLLSLLSQTDRQALEERLAHLISQGKFWKYGKHKTPQVNNVVVEQRALDANKLKSHHCCGCSC